MKNVRAIRSCPKCLIGSCTQKLGTFEFLVNFLSFFPKGMKINIPSSGRPTESAMRVMYGGTAPCLAVQVLMKCVIPYLSLVSHCLLVNA